MQTATAFPPLDQETRTHVNTECAAYHLNRSPQTLRVWASSETGPLRPIRINRYLAWSIADIKRLLNGGANG
jgi:hypothetical protein